MKNDSFSKLPLFITLFVSLVLGSCGIDSNKPPEVEQDLPTTESVAPDGVLETVTWNLEWYGSTGNGPTDELQQTKNVLRVVDSLDADLYTFQEISDQQALDKLTEQMTDYEGFVADYISYNQKMAFVYNTNTIDSLRAGPILNVGAPYKEDWKYYWANGREPFYFEFQFTAADGSKSTYYAISIHAKANTGDNSQEYQESYQRRQKAAEGLYHYLRDEKPSANIILLGDYNDDVDQSIYYEKQDGEKVYQETPYDDFVNDRENFKVITKTFSDSRVSASINYKDIIDHITMSNELFDNYLDGSAKVYHDAQEHISDYEDTTSDHLPVLVKFGVTQ